jgi:UDP-N-acetylglucosamine 2-epimerase
VGANLVAGVSPDRVVHCFRQQQGRKSIQDTDWERPFGDGKAADRIADAIAN